MKKNLLLTGVITLAVVSGGGYWYYQQRANPSDDRDFSSDCSYDGFEVAFKSGVSKEQALAILAPYGKFTLAGFIDGHYYYSRMVENAEEDKEIADKLDKLPEVESAHVKYVCTE